MATNTSGFTATGDSSTADADGTVDQRIDLETFLAKEQTLPFCGLTPDDATSAS